MPNLDQAALRSRPIGVEWAGWRTDTLTLQQNGWELAVEYDIMRQAYTLLMRHRMMRLYAISDRAIFENYMDVVSPSYDASRLPLFRVQHVANSFEVVRLPQIGEGAGFNQIDAQPCFDAQRTITRVEDMNIFNVPLTRTEEVVIDKADMSVIEHLEAIKEMQSEEQKAIRERIIREGAHRDGMVVGAGPQMEVVANIVSFG